MSETRPWAAYAAMAVLAGLLVTAYLARGQVHASMSIEPRVAAPGKAFTVQFAEPQVGLSDLTFERGGKTHLLVDDEWVDTTTLNGWQAIVDFEPTRSWSLTLPPEVEPGTYRVCTSSLGHEVPDLEEFGDLDDVVDLCTTLRVENG